MLSADSDGSETRQSCVDLKTVSEDQDDDSIGPTAILGEMNSAAIAQIPSYASSSDAVGNDWGTREIVDGDSLWGPPVIEPLGQHFEIDKKPDDP